MRWLEVKICYLEYDTHPYVVKAKDAQGWMTIGQFKLLERAHQRARLAKENNIIAGEGQYGQQDKQVFG